MVSVLHRALILIGCVAQPPLWAGTSAAATAHRDTGRTGDSIHPSVELPTMVITESRSPKQAGLTNLPVQIISGSDIADQGHINLSDILDEQLGITVVSDHGDGLQMQGLNLPVIP